MAAALSDLRSTRNSRGLRDLGDKALRGWPQSLKAKNPSVEKREARRRPGALALPRAAITQSPSTHPGLWCQRDERRRWAACSTRAEARAGRTPHRSPSPPGRQQHVCAGTARTPEFRPMRDVLAPTSTCLVCRQGRSRGRSQRPTSCRPARHPAVHTTFTAGVAGAHAPTCYQRGPDVTASSAGERTAARIGCSLAEAFTVTRRGHQVWLDDGKLGGVVESVDQDSIELRITSAGARGSKLRAGKGINLPDAVLDIDLLGAHSPGRPAVRRRIRRHRRAVVC